MSINIEDTYVKDVYNDIASHFDLTRQYHWKSVKQFVNSLPVGSFIGDIGCGSGKNMNIRNDCTFMGYDFSQSMVDVCRNKGLNVTYGDILDLPCQPNTFDHCLCIAVIHHLCTVDNRIKAIQQLSNVVKLNGKIFIQVWAETAYDNIKYKSSYENQGFNNRDVLIPWHDKKGNVYQRYYHLFAKNELEQLIQNNCPELYIIDSHIDHDNYVVICEKRLN